MPERYSVLWSGDLPPSALWVETRPEERIRLDPDERAELERMLARRGAAGQRILRAADGTLPPLYRLTAQRLAPDGLHLTLGQTDYGEYLWTNVERPERRATHGDGAMSDALAVCAVLVSGDGRALYGTRSAAIADRAADRRLHVVPAGHPEPPASPVDGLLRELREEAGLERCDIARLRLTGLVRSAESGKPELCFLLETRLPLEAILERERADAWEYESLESFAWEPAALRAWLTRHAHELAPPGLAAIELGAGAAFDPPAG